MRADSWPRLRYAETMRRALALLLALAIWPVSAALIEGRVIEVVDGDSLSVLSKAGASIHKVRLAGIVVPPMNHPYGDRSRENLRRLMVGQSVRLVTSTLDQHGQLVGTVWVKQNASECRAPPCPEKLDAALVQLSAGLAWVDSEQLAHKSPEMRDNYLKAERHAKERRLGLWRDPGPSVRPAERSATTLPLKVDSTVQRPR